MITKEELESLLIRMDLEFQEVDEGMYLVRFPNNGPPVVVHHAPPLLLLRLKVMDLPEEKNLTKLFETLLVWNASDLVHGAYGIEEGELVLTDTLELEDLDFTELQASLESLQMAASSHMERIRELAGIGREG